MSNKRNNESTTSSSRESWYPPLAVGDEFRGGTVANIDDTIHEDEDTIRMKRIVTMMDGIVLKLEHVKEKSPDKPKPKLKRYFSKNNSKLLQDDNNKNMNSSDVIETAGSSVQSFHTASEETKNSRQQGYGGCDSPDGVKEYWVKNGKTYSRDEGISSNNSYSERANTSSGSILQSSASLTSSKQSRWGGGGGDGPGDRSCDGGGTNDPSGAQSRNNMKVHPAKRDSRTEKNRTQSVTSLSTTDPSSNELSSEEEEKNINGDDEGSLQQGSSPGSHSRRSRSKNKRTGLLDNMSIEEGDDKGKRHDTSPSLPSSSRSRSRSNNSDKYRLTKQGSGRSAGSIKSNKSNNSLGSIKSNKSLSSSGGGSRSSRHQQRRRRQQQLMQNQGFVGNTSDHSSSSSDSASGKDKNRSRRPRKKRQNQSSSNLKETRFSSSQASPHSSIKSKDTLLARPKRQNSIEGGKYSNAAAPPARPMEVEETVSKKSTPSKLRELEESLLRQNYHFVEGGRCYSQDYDDDISIPLSILVYDQHDPDLPPRIPGDRRGFWVYEGMDDDSSSLSTYGRHAVFLHQPTTYSSGSESLTLTVDETEEQTTGFWGYRDGEQPSDGESWHPTGDALVLPPSARAPKSFVPAGKYTFALATPTRRQRDIRTHLRESLSTIDTTATPEVFKQNGNKLPVRVGPKSQVSNLEKEIMGSGIPVAHWVSYFDAQGNPRYDGDDHSLPVADIDLYVGNDRPPGSPTGGGLLGLWGCYKDSQLDLENPESWDPGDVLIFPPGLEHSHKVQVLGSWGCKGSNNDSIIGGGALWPPELMMSPSTESRRLSKIQIPDIFGQATDVPSAFQSPQRPSGRNSFGDATTPKKTPRLSNVGRLKVPNTFGQDEIRSRNTFPKRKAPDDVGEFDSVPLSILVFSQSAPDLPPRMPGRNRGIWVYGEEEDFENASLWKAQEVLLYRPGAESLVSTDDSYDPSSSRQSGIWGYPEGEQPNDHESWHPKGEALVVPPNTQAPTRFIPAGTYTYAYDDQRFPPPIVVESPNRRTRKLEFGDFYSSPGRLESPRRDVGRLKPLPSMESPTRRQKNPGRLELDEFFSSPGLGKSPLRDPGKLVVEQLFPPPLIESPTRIQRDPGRLRIPKCFSNF